MAGVHLALPPSQRPLSQLMRTLVAGLALPPFRTLILPPTVASHLVDLVDLTTFSPMFGSKLIYLRLWDFLGN